MRFNQWARSDFLIHCERGETTHVADFAVGARFVLVPGVGEEVPQKSGGVVAAAGAGDDAADFVAFSSSLALQSA